MLTAKEADMDLNDVPECARDLVADAEKYTVADWQRLTPGWDIWFKMIAIAMRRKTPAERERIVKEKREVLETWSDDIHTKYGESSDLAVMFVCLSDEKLDDIISTFSPADRQKLGYLS